MRAKSKTSADRANYFHLVDTPVRYGAAWIIANDDFSSWEIVNGHKSQLPLPASNPSRDRRDKNMGCRHHDVSVNRRPPG
jgi:hypothetical protein